MDRYFNRKRQRGKEDYPSYKNKKRKFSNEYSGKKINEDYKLTNIEPYSYQRSDYNSFGHEDYYKTKQENIFKNKIPDERKYNYYQNYNNYRDSRKYDYYNRDYYYSRGNNYNDAIRRKRSYSRKNIYNSKSQRSSKSYKYNSNYSKYYRNNKMYRSNSGTEKDKSCKKNSYSSSNSKSKQSNPESSSSSSYSDKSSLLYPYKLNEIIKNKYMVQKHLSDGTFGRVMQVENIQNKKIYAMKIILPIKKYIESARLEAKLVEKVLEKDIYNKSHVIKIYEHFHFYKGDTQYYAIVFELLGLSLYEFLKSNSFKGYTMNQIKHIARQVFEGIEFLHSIDIVHTDLKPENILLVNSSYDKIKNYENIPINISFGEESDSGNNSFISTKNISSPSKSKSLNKKREKTLYKKLINTNIKIIDFGSAVEQNDIGSGIINTRQYRSPEVILECCRWDNRSDIWSIACILIELYTGELLFRTHDNQEHLSLIEKVCGHYPNWMVRNTKNKNLRDIFVNCRRHKDDKVVDIRKCEKYNEVKKALSHQRTLSESVCPRHHAFWEFIQYLLKIDPKERPSAKEALRHQFFRTNFTD